MKESLVSLVVQNRSAVGGTSASHSAPPLELVEEQSSVTSSSSSHEAGIAESGELPSSFSNLPNNSMRIRYLREREKLLKQLTADCFLRSHVEDRDGEDGNGDDYYFQYKLPCVVSPPSENNHPITSSFAEKAEDMKVLSNEVITPSLNNSRKKSNAVLNNLQSTERRKAHDQEGDENNSPKTNPNSFMGENHQSCTPNVSVLTPRQVTLSHPSPIDAKKREKKNTNKKGNTKNVFTSKRYIKWRTTFDTMFEELKKYKKKHGHCNILPKKIFVPGEYSHLAIWVSRTRDSCKKYLAAEDTSGMYMDEEKMQLLKDIGFDMHADAFSRRVRELERFKEKYGHLNVPIKGRYESLGRWCCLERSVCRDFEAGKTVRTNGTKMTRERLEMLRKIGFDWSKRYGQPIVKS